MSTRFLKCRRLSRGPSSPRNESVGQQEAAAPVGQIVERVLHSETGMQYRLEWTSAAQGDGGRGGQEGYWRSDFVDERQWLQSFDEEAWKCVYIHTQSMAPVI